LGEFLNESEQNETKQWSMDQKSYVAMKIIPGFGTLIYMACTDKPELGWDENGFASFIDISDVPTVFDEPNKQANVTFGPSNDHQPQPAVQFDLNQAGPSWMKNFKN
jgi:hypothetical protein